MADTPHLIALDKAHLWHPFTPMRQWRQSEPLIVDRAEGFELIDSEGRRYIDGVSSLWCNVHGHRVPAIDDAIRAQLDKVAHTTLLGLASTPSIELAAELVRWCAHLGESRRPLNKVFYSDAGATALEVAFKMAVGYWYHRGQPQRHTFIGLSGAYHGDTVGAMSVGYSELFHRPFSSMVFPVRWSAAPDTVRLLDRLAPQGSVLQRDMAMRGLFPSQDPACQQKLAEHCLADLDRVLAEHSQEVAAVVIEPVMQGAAGMVCQPAGFLRGVADRCRRHGVLLIADEVATGFGRTGWMFACQSEGVTPDVLCLAKGITGGYLPLAATLATDEIDDAFCGELAERRTLYHGHTYTGNALACAAALANLKLFGDPQSSQPRLIAQIQASAQHLEQRLAELRDEKRFPHVLDVRQRGMMVGIELGQSRRQREPLDFSRRTAAQLCLAMRHKGLIIRPLGDVLVLMPAPAMDRATLDRMLDIVLQTLRDWRW